MELVLGVGYLVFLRAFVHFCELFGGRDDSSDVFFHGICPVDDCFDCALLGNNTRQGCPDFLVVIVVCFVGF